MQVLLTGAAGFIGSHTAEMLLAKGHTVAAVDNFTGFYDPQIKRRNFAEVQRTAASLGRAGAIRLIEADICDESRMRALFEDYRPDIVVHLAAHAGVRNSIEHAALYQKVNIGGTVNLLECMKHTGCGKMVFASSSSVYGNSPKVPFAETDPVDFPISPYAATKKAGELLCYTYHHIHGFSIACLRFFTVYGERQRPDLAIHKFARLMLEEKEIPFYGDGTTRRDYTYIGDTLEGVYAAFEWVCGGSRPRYDIFNLGESNTVSLTEMVETLAKALNVKPKIRKLPHQPGDVMQTYADISKSMRILGYRPKTGFEQGISLFVEWLKKANV